MEKYQIYKAVLASDYKSALQLIDSKVDLNELDINGHTPLHWAVFRGNLDFVKILLEAGANPNIFSSDGVTPKWQAKDFGLTNIDKLLDSFGGKILTNEDFDKTNFSVFYQIIKRPLSLENTKQENSENMSKKKK